MRDYITAHSLAAGVIVRDAEDAEVKEFLNNREIPIIQKTPQPSAGKNSAVSDSLRWKRCTALVKSLSIDKTTAWQAKY